jgi:hypothetical protein
VGAISTGTGSRCKKITWPEKCAERHIEDFRNSIQPPAPGTAAMPAAQKKNGRFSCEKRPFCYPAPPGERPSKFFSPSKEMMCPILVAQNQVKDGFYAHFSPVQNIQIIK